MSKICKIGTKRAVITNLIKNSVIDSNNKILKPDLLRQLHFVYKEYLFKTFGIDDNIILTSPTSKYLAFNNDALYKIDALYGIYYDENEKYHRNIVDNETLTPIDIANKYIKITDRGEVALQDIDLLLSNKEFQKFKIGMSKMFPEYLVESRSMTNLTGDKLISLKLTKVEDGDTGITSRTIDGIAQSEADIHVQMDVVQKAIEPLLNKFKNVNIHWINESDVSAILVANGKPIAMSNGKVNALAVGSDIFLVKGRVTPKTAIEEFMHIFVDSLAVDRPALFEGLKNKALVSHSELHEEIKALYPEQLFGRDYIEKELVTQALRDAYVSEREQRPEGVELNEFFKLAKRFFDWLFDKLNQVFDMSFDKPRAEVSELPIDMTLQELATFLNINDVEIPYAETTDVRFSIGAEESNEDSFIEAELEQKIDFSKLSEKEIAQLKKDKKLEKANLQVKKLKKLKNRYTSKTETGKITETIDKLLSMTYGYVDVLENDSETVSTTNFIGSPEFNESSQKANKKYQYFGTFIHNFIEHLQDNILFSEKEKISPITLFAANDYEFFLDFYKENKHLLTIEGLDEGTLASDMINIVAIVSAEAAEGNLIIPELTTFGKDSLGRNLVGRIDYMVIRPDGTVSTRDFKTNKVRRKLSVYNDAYLHNTLSTKLKLNPSVHPAFESFPGRSKVGSYLSQVGTYKRLLAQHGIRSVNDAIINIMYGKKESFDEDEFTYDKAFVKMIDIEGEMGLKYTRDKDGTPTANLDPLYERIISALHSAIPVEGEEQTEQQAKASAVRDIQYIENLNEEKIKQLVANLKDKIQTQLTSLKEELQNARNSNADETVIKKLEERRTSLFEIQAQFDSTYKTDEGFKAIADQVILKSALDKVIELISTINKECKEIAKSTNEKTKIASLRTRFEQINDLKNFLDIFNSILLENGVPETSTLIKEITEGIIQSNAAKSEYIKVAEEKFIEMLLKVPKVTAEAMMKDYKAMINPKIQKLERIVRGDASVFDKGSTIWLSSIKKLVGVSTGQSIEVTGDMMSAAQSELNRINNFIKYEKFDREFVKLYVENTFNNPEHGWYIGSTITTGFGGLSTDDLRSSFGNSELALTAVANLMINMTLGAKTRFNQQMEDLKIDSYIKKAATSAGGYDALNNLLREKVTLLGKDGKSREFMKFVGPILQDYFNTYDAFDYEIRKISQQVEENERNIAVTPEEIDNKKNIRKDLSEQKTQKLKKFTEWLVKNSETKMVAEIYMLEVQMPIDIQDKIKKINSEIALKRSNNEDFELDATTIDYIQQKELEVEQLKKEAIERDPSLKDVFDKYEKYFSYEVNWDRFNYMKNRMIKKYGEESMEFKTWLELNSEMIASEDWRKNIQELREEANLLYKGNPILTDLYNQRKEIIEKYKFKSKFSVYRTFNPAYMSETDAQLLEDLEYAIEKEQEKPKSKLVGDNYKRAEEIRNEINSLRQTINKPSYERTLRNKVKELLDTYNESEKETDDKQKAFLQQQFKTKEDAFKHWYERNNDATYKLGTIVNRGSVNAVPRKFNTMEVPTDPSMMERVPTSKYKTRYYKQEAYNPNYTGTLEKRRFGKGEYALPKGISYDQNSGRWAVDRNSQWYDPKFDNILKNNNLLDAYNTIVMDLYYNKQRNMNSNKLGLFFPGVMQNAFDSIATDGVQGLKREMNETLNNVRLKNSATDAASNEYGVAGKNRIVFPHNYMLDADLVTKDGINAVIQWNQQYEVNQSMEEANLIVSPAIDFLKEGMSQVNNPMQKKQLQKVIDIMEYERNKLVFGQTTNNATQAGKRPTNKLMKMFLSAVSWGRLAFDPAMQVGNLVAGNVQTFLATQMKGAGRAGTYEDYLWAKAKMYGPDGFIYNLVSDWGGLSDLSLSTKIYRFMDPTMKASQKLDITSKNKAQRLLRRGLDVKDLAFVIQDKGEMEIAITTMLKTLKATLFYMYETDAKGNVVVDAEGNKVLKTDAQGNFVQISAYEALVNKDGSATPGIREDVAMTNEDLEGVRAMAQQEYMRHQGNYSSMTKSPIEGSILGQLIMFFRKYLVPAIEVRFKGLADKGDARNWIAGEAQLGWWTGFFKIFEYYGATAGIKELILPAFANKNSSVDLYYRNKMYQVRRDILVAVAFTMAYAAARALIYSNGDDDDKELTWTQMQALRVLVKVSNESRSLTPLPHFGKMGDYITNFSTFTTAFSEGIEIVKIVENLAYYTGYELFDSDYMHDLGYYKRREGRYEKGDPKLFKGISKLTGVENIQDIFSPEYALKQQYQGKK